MDFSKITKKQWLIGGGALVAVLAVMGSQKEGGGNIVPCGPGITTNCTPSNDPGSTGGTWGSSGSSSGMSDANGGTYTVMDQNGFGQAMPAATISVPAGWRAEGYIRWTGSVCDPDNPGRYVRLLSADGSRQIEYLPGMIIGNMLSIQPTGRCIQTQISGAEQLVRDVIVPNAAQGFSVQSMNQGQVPPQLQQQASQLPREVNPQTFAIDVTLAGQDGSSALLQIAGITNRINNPVQGMASPIFVSVTKLQLLRGPREALPQMAQVAEQVVESTKFNPQWQQKLHEHRMKMINGGRPVPGGSSSGGGGSTSSGSGGTGENFPGERRGERDTRRFIETIRETKRCIDPDTGQVVEVPESTLCE